MSQSRRTSFSALVVTALAASASAQIQAYTFQGTSSGNQFGTCARNAGDVDADGFDDIIVGEPFANPNGNDSGRARVYSGKTGAVLHTFEGQNAGDELGTSVAGMGDVDFDGRSELIVGAPKEASPFVHGGVVRIYSGATGNVLSYVLGQDVGQELGTSVASAGDIDGDSRPDALAGMPYWDAGAPDGGGFLAISGLTLQPFPGGTWYGNVPGGMVGWSLAGAGNIDHDGHDDVVVGAPHAGANSEGRIDVLSVWLGTILYSKVGGNASAQLGYSVTGARDFDGDGWHDFAGGAPYDDSNGTNAGRVRVFSGQTGNVLHTIDGTSGNHFGHSISAITDTNGDGDDDLLVGAPYADSTSDTNAGVVRLLASGGSTILESFWGGSGGAHMGWSASRGGDINNDGTADVIGGAPGASPNGADSGLARVWFLGCPSPNTYCTAKVNSSGCTPQIDFSGVPTRVTGADDFEITASHVLKDKSGILFWGFDNASTPFHGGTLCVEAPTVRTPIQNSGCSTCNACQGTYLFAFDHAYMAANNVHSGDTLYAQFWSRDPGFTPPNSIGLTDALRFTVCK